MDILPHSDRADNARCQHRQRLYTRRGPHVAEVCPACGANVRGPGRWVPHAELEQFGITPDALPQLDVLQDQIVARQQPSLWGAGA
jgi:hypothetical protein